jgi:3-phenylpropionate/trans-cinnamate dioxygenase ferredoxin reductase subunit
VEQEPFIVVGGGQSGLQVCESLRTEGFDGDVLLISNEADLPYQRPPLSKKFLTGEVQNERLLFRQKDYFQKKDIEFIGSNEVTSVNLADQTLAIRDQSLRYSKLALATGTRIRPFSCPGSEEADIHYIRSIADGIKLRESLKSSKKLLVIGGGFIGLEVAAVGRQLGLEVHVVESATRLMSRVVAAQISDYYADYHRNQGVNLHLGDKVMSIETKQGDDSRVFLEKGGEVRADLIVAGIGVLPNQEIAENSGIKCGNGILVDEECRTSDPHVFASGDCANHENAYFRGRVRLESVQNAVDQAKIAAKSMLGKSALYNSAPWFWSDQYDKKLQMVGKSTACDHAVLRGDVSSGSFSYFYFLNDRLLGVDSVNAPIDHMISRKVLQRKISLNPVQASDENFDLKGLILS